MTETASADATSQRASRPVVAPTVSSARHRKRHWLLYASFIVMVLVPSSVSFWYLNARAADRYVSTVSFSVRREEVGSAIELLGGVAELSGSSTTDTEILYDFIQSQELVRLADERLNLREAWARGDPEVDPVFAFHPPGTIEDLVSYWRRMVEVFNSGDGLLEVQVQAFTPDEARALSTLIYDESSALVNRLSAVARDDATGYARDELDRSVERLKVAREEITRFRNRTQIVDPSASVQSQMGLLSSLQLQLAEALIDLDILRQQTNDSDPRITQAERRVGVIEDRIAQERDKLGIGTGINSASSAAFADLVGEYERLIVDQEFAEQSYTASLAAYDASVAEARRQSRYLAAHVRPTLAEASEEPQRLVLWGLVTLFAFLIWAMSVLAAYALRDRR
ncbi:MAG: capsule biosynthesis protein [Jannaschia sp.]